MHRTATALQVRRFFHHRFGTLRSARMHLQTLAAEGDLEVVRSQTIGGPNVYLITNRGLRKVAVDRDESFGLHRRRPTGSHLPHELLITEFAVQLRESERQLTGLRIEWAERFGIQRHDCFRGLVPDYAFLFQHSHGRLACLVEVSSGEESIIRLRQKLMTYSLWIETDDAQRFLVDLYRRHGASRPRPEFRLLCVMHRRRGEEDDAALRQLVRAAADGPPSMRRRIWCTTAQALAEEGTLEAAIWLRLADVEGAFEEAASTSGRALSRRLAAAQRTAPRQSLFPKEAGP